MRCFHKLSGEIICISTTQDITDIDPVRVIVIENNVDVAKDNRDLVELCNAISPKYFAMMMKEVDGFCSFFHRLFSNYPILCDPIMKCF